jgi:signal transduction histidine kinase
MMKRRLLFSTLAVAVVAVLLLGVPLAYAVYQVIYDETREQLERDAVQVVAGVQLRQNAGQPITARSLARDFPGRYILVTLPDERQVSVGRAPSDPQRALSKSAQAFGIHVQVSKDSEGVKRYAWRSVALIGSLSALGLAVAVGLAMVQARRLTLPLIDVAETAERLGTGDARPRRRRYGIPEVDRVAEVLDQSAVRIAGLLAASREFASDASHQLRTPLTALSMRLEEMVAAAADPATVREEGVAALSQVERLVAVVEQLLARARHDPTGAAVPTVIADVIEQQVEEWQPLFRRAKRELCVTGQDRLKALVTPGGLAQIIATLLDNSLVHGAGTVTIHTKSTATSVVVEVSDEGPGIRSDLTTRVFERNVSGRKGTGLGLYLARTLADADAGRLELVQACPATFALFLRKTEEAELARSRVVSGPA